MMKSIILLLAGFISLAPLMAHAQQEIKPLLIDTPQKPAVTVTICVLSRNRLLTPPLYIIFSHNKLIFRSDTAANNNFIKALNPSFIKTINVLKNDTTVMRYGKSAQYGVIAIYLDDKKYPRAYRLFKRTP